MRHIIKIFIIPSQPKPRGGIPCAGGGFKIAKRTTGVVSEVFRVGTAGSEGGAEVHGFSYIRGGMSTGITLEGASYLENEGYGDLNETHEGWVVDDSWAHGGICAGGGESGLLVDEE